MEVILEITSLHYKILIYRSYLFYSTFYTFLNTNIKT